MEKLEQLESKYYTPSIEEFHVGFEYEAFLQQFRVLEEPHQEGDNWVYPVENIGYNWVPQVYKQGDFCTIDYENEEVSFRDIYPSEIRVRYLDKEDIESLGWTEIAIDQYVKGDYFILVDSDLFLQVIYENPSIKHTWSDDPDAYLFQGTIKNKSELKVLLKQLGIDV